jgi:hypothetical protein
MVSVDMSEPPEVSTSGSAGAGVDNGVTAVSGPHAQLTAASSRHVVSADLRPFTRPNIPASGDDHLIVTDGESDYLADA